MARPPRAARGGIVYHVLNRANARQQIFESELDYAAFMKVLREGQKKFHMRILAYCIMPNHWHLILWPLHDDDLSQFTGWITFTHSERRHAHRHTTGTGHLYQDRFKSFPVQTDEHLLTVCRYVERNGLRAGLVERAEEWKWSSLWLREHGTEKELSLLEEGPTPKPSNWISWVNHPHTSSELDSLRLSITRGRPFGAINWVEETAEQLGLISTLRERGRPKTDEG